MTEGILDEACPALIQILAQPGSMVLALSMQVSPTQVRKASIALFLYEAAKRLGK